MPHIVFVESNTLGLQALTAAKEEGHSVTFVGSRTNGPIYGWDGQQDAPSGLPDLPEFAAVDRCVFVANSMDADILTTALSQIHQEQPVDAVISVLEYCVHAASEAARRLGLRATSAAAVAMARDKYQMRRCLREAGIEDVACITLATPEAIDRWTTYPAVAKPMAGAASDFVRVVHHAGELREALADYTAGLGKIDPALAREIGTGLLVEAYLEGPMLSVEVLMHQGQPHVLSIGQRERSQHNEVIELGSLMPADLPPAVSREVTLHTAAALEALGFDRGIFHVEVMQTEAGPRLIELNARLMGGPLPALYRRVYGANVYKLLIATHLDLALPELPQAAGHGVARVFGTFAGGPLKPQFALDWVKDFDRCGLELQLQARPGQVAPRLQSNHDYLGLFTVLGETAAEATASADAVIVCLGQTLGVNLAI